MAPPRRVSLRPLTHEEQTALARLAKASSERVDRVRRATALVAVGEGHSFAQAAQRAGLRSHSTVADLVERFNREGLGALRIATGRGRKPTYGPVARAEIVATAQRPPDRRADGTGTWSLSTLPRTLRRQDFPALGRTTIRRVLRDAGSSYQMSRTWCPTGTAERKRKSGIVRVVDPATEQKRGSSSRRIASGRGPACQSGVRMRPAPTKSSPNRGPAGARSSPPCGSRTSTSAVGRSSC